jgi:hypothetical protein
MYFIYLYAQYTIFIFGGIMNTAVENISVINIVGDIYHAIEHLLIPIKVDKEACEKFIGTIEGSKHVRLYMLACDYHMFAMYVIDNETNKIEYYLIKTIGDNHGIS